MSGQMKYEQTSKTEQKGDLNDHVNCTHSAFTYSFTHYVPRQNDIIHYPYIFWRQRVIAVWDAGRFQWGFPNLQPIKFKVSFASHAYRPAKVCKIKRSVCYDLYHLWMSGYVIFNVVSYIFIVTPCMLSSYSIITPTTAHIKHL